MNLTTIETRDASTELGELPILTLTILAHPRLERLGQQCVLQGSGPFELSRSEGVFCHPGSAGAPIADSHISRKPVEIRADISGVVISSENRKAKLDGQPLGLVRKIVEIEALERGVLLSLGSKVALLLRRAEPGLSLRELGMVGPSPELRRAQERIRRFARGHQPVLITGATGTGKELAARAIHEQSPRAGGPWVAVNIAALPPSTAASQLFGHVRGAFTGAATASAGLFGAAAGGSLFLDELGEAPSDVQPLLLRALESGEVQVVGGSTRTIDVRVIAATDANLDEAMASGRLRPALYHRLAGATVELTPLCARREDIAAQLRHFVLEQLEGLGRMDKLEQPGWFGARAQLAFVSYVWPGNTRQLQRTIEATLLDSLELDAIELPPVLEGMADAAATSQDSAPAPAPQLSASSSSSGTGSISSEMLEQALVGHQFRLKLAAEALGVSVNTLKSLMKRHGFRRAKDLSAAEIEAARTTTGDDIHELAAELRVSAHALRLRIRELL